MIDSACNTKRLVSGPAAYYQCLNRQVEALEQSPRAPDLSVVTPAERDMIDSACNTKRLVSGPAAYYQCLNRQVEALEQSPRAPDLSVVTPAERDMTRSACNIQRLVSGPAAYYQCLNRQVGTPRRTTPGQREPPEPLSAQEKPESIDSIVPQRSERAAQSPQLPPRPEEWPQLPLRPEPLPRWWPLRAEQSLPGTLAVPPPPIGAPQPGINPVSAPPPPRAPAESPGTTPARGLPLRRW